jgi:subtilisin family serine protease
MKRQKGLISPRHVRSGRISKDYGASACLKGVPEVEELWNIGSANSEDRGFVGYARKGTNMHRVRKLRRGFCPGSSTHVPGNPTNRALQQDHSKFGFVIAAGSIEHKQLTQHAILCMISAQNESMIPEIQLLWAETLGDPGIRVAVLDGPVDVHHPSLRGAQLSSLPTLVPNVVGKGAASSHGTSIASVLFGQHLIGPVQGAAPGCTGLLLPIFSDDSDSPVVGCSQLDLARAIVQATESQAHIINVSAGQYSPSGEPHPILREAVDYAASRDVLIVAAAGNDGCECLHLPGAQPSVLAVGAMDHNSQPLDFSNWGAVYSKNGIIALGEEIKVALPGGQYGVMTGTSCAAAIVAGVAALLLSIQRERGDPVHPTHVRQALLKSAVPCDPRFSPNCHRMMAGQLNIANALQLLLRREAPMSDSDQNKIEVERETEPPSTVVPSQVHPSDCGCGCGGSKDTSTRNISSSTSPAPLQLVYAIGTLGFDFGSEARRDSILQHVTTGSETGNPTFDLNALLKYLDKNPWDAQSLLWTLNLDSTPIYAIQPAGAFAAAGYDRLRQFLREQVADDVERVSVPGILVGRARLMNGQVVPGLVPDLRGMNNWNTSALVDAVSSTKGSGKTSHRTEGITSFLDRIYYGFRNLGLTSQDRALNFAATNALNVAKVFESAVKDGMQLDTVETERSPVCRPESDCWDVKLVFFDPENQMQRARIVYRFTVDVSDINPVMVGPVRSWPVP